MVRNFQRVRSQENLLRFRSDPRTNNRQQRGNKMTDLLTKEERQTGERWYRIRPDGFNIEVDDEHLARRPIPQHVREALANQIMACQTYHIPSAEVVYAVGRVGSSGVNNAKI